MYTKLKKCVAASCALLLVSFFMSEAKAAAASEEEKVSATSTEESLTPGTIDLDVPAYLVRYLYREADSDSIQIKHWYNGWGWMFYWNPDVLAFPSATYVNRFNMSVKGLGIAISKDFNKHSGIRIGANFSSVTHLNDATAEEKELTRANVSIDYLWNLSNTYYGYDTHRTDEWLLTAGVKGGKLLSEGDLFGSVNLGLQYRKNIANDMSFFVEPQFAFFSDMYDNSKTFYEVDPGLNLLVGLYFRAGQPKMDIYTEDIDPLKNTFFQLYGGVVNGSETYAFKTLGQGGYQRHGLNFGFNAGAWLNPSLGLRAGYFENAMGIGFSDKVIQANTAYQTYRGGRFEVVINPITILTNKTSLGRFGLDLSVGYEAGVLNKHKLGYDNTWTASGQEEDRNHINYFASGVTFASQLKYYLSKNYALYAEGRFSSPMYSASSGDNLTTKGSLSDKLMSWAVGMEYYISTFERYSRFAKGDNHEARAIERIEQDNRWYVETAFGFGEATHWGENFKGRRGATFDVALGMNANDYHGFRLRAGANRKFLEARPEGRKYNIQGTDYQFALSADYMFNATNLWWGIDETDTRWSDLYLFVGPTIQIDPHDMRNSIKGKSGYGFEIGTQLTRRLGPGVELFAEPRYEYTVHAADRWNVMAGLKLYQHREKNYHYRDSIARHDRQSWFMEVAGGAGMDLTGSLGVAKDRATHPDMDARLAFGYRINPISSVRFNTNFIAFNGFGKSENGERNIEVSFDYMANLLNLWYGNNPHRIFQLQGYLGALVNPDRMMEVACTEDIAYEWKFGVQAGAQLIYSPFQNVSLFIQPQMTYYLSDYITKSGAEREKYKRDEHLDLFAGLIFYNQPGRLPERGYNTTKVDSVRSWYYEMAAGGAFTASGREGNVQQNIVPSVYIGIGHYINELSSVRARLSLVDSRRNSDYVAYRDKFVTGLSLDYVYNLSNRLLGVNPYRRFDFSLYGGPTAEFHNSAIDDNDGWDNIRYPYVGFNVGDQFSWHVNNYLDIFAETRALLNLKHHTRYEALAGVKLYQNTEKTAQYRDSAAQHAYTWFMETAGGVGKTMTGTQDKLDGTGKIAVGYRFNPISSLRMSAAAWTHFNRGEVSFDYMANLLNLWYGLDPYRRVNLRGYVGPTMVLDNFTSAENNFELNFGYDAGLQLSVGLTDNIDLLLEPRFVGDLTAGHNHNRLDGYAGLIFYNQRGLMEARDYNIINTDSERGWFMEVTGGANFASDGRTDGIWSHIDPLLNLGIGRFINNYSSVRARGGLGYIRNTATNKNYKSNPRWMPEVSVDYIYNLTNQVLGVNPYRRFDLSLYAGPMAYIGGLMGGSLKPSWGANAGAQVAWHVNNFVDLFVEPRVDYFFKEDLYTRANGLAGIRLYQNKTNNIQYLGTEAKHGNTWFLETAGGAGSELAGQNRPDFTLKMAAGYRFNPISSLRLSGMAWTRKLANGKSRARSAEVAVDYMANIQNILYGVNPDRRFNLRGFVGGIAAPDNFLAMSDMSFNLGVNLGLQGTYAIAENIDLMVEPRVAKFVKGVGCRTPRGDVYAGLVFYNDRGLSMRRGIQPTDIDDKNTWFIDMAGGLSFSPDGRTGGGILNNIDKDVQMGLGIHLNNYSSLRGRGNLTFVQSPKMTKDRRGHLPELALDYMFNLSNAVLGINPYRRFDLTLFGGPVARVSGIRKLSNMKMKFGVDGGAQLAWHMNDNWDLFGEGRLLLSNQTRFSSRLSALGGIAYRFNKNSLNEATFDFSSNRIYTQVLAGAQVVDVEEFKLEKIKTFTSLPTINYNLGFRINKLIALQAGIYSEHLSVEARKKAFDIYSNGVRAEVALGLMNMFSPSYDANENRFNWTASLGAQTGRIFYENNTSKYGFGLTAATQAQYRVFSNSWAVFELRARALHAKNGLSIPITAQLGVMYDFNKIEQNNNTASPWYVQAGAGVANAKAGMMEFAAGYDATPVHGFRASFGKSFSDLDAAGELIAISPDYVCNLSNLFLGHDDDKRHVDFSALVGADFQMYNKDGAAKNSFGVNVGTQMTFNINKNWQIYTEPRLSFSPKADADADLKHEGLNFQTTVGLKYRLPKF